MNEDSKGITVEGARDAVEATSAALEVGCNEVPRVVTYARVYGEHESNPDQSLDAQRKACMERVRAHGFVPADASDELETSRSGADDGASGVSSSTQASSEVPRAVLYLRVASGKRTDRETAIVAQQHRCERRAAELGARVVDVYVDFGSGVSAERPQLRRMLDELDAVRDDPMRRIEYVIAYDHHRVALTMRVYARVVWEVEHAGARLNIASIPLTAYAAMPGGLFGDGSEAELLQGVAWFVDLADSVERSQAIKEGLAKRRKRLQGEQNRGARDEQSGDGSDVQRDA